MQRTEVASFRTGWECGWVADLEWKAPWCGVFHLWIEVGCERKRTRRLHFELGGSAVGYMNGNGRGALVWCGVVSFFYELSFDIEDKRRCPTVSILVYNG